MFPFSDSGKIEVNSNSELLIEDVKNEVYHQLFQYGAIAERTDDGVTFKQGFFRSMARKPIAGLSSGKISINESGKGILMSYQINSINSLIGSPIAVFILVGIQWLSDGKLFPIEIYVCLWVILLVMHFAVRTFEFNGFLRKCAIPKS